MLLFFETDTPQWLTIVGGGIFALLGIIVTYFLSRPKSNADAAHILAQTNAILATRLNTVTKELDETAQHIPYWTKTLEASVKNRDELKATIAELEEKVHEKDDRIEQLTTDMAKEPLGQHTVEELTELAESIVENISHIYFIPAGELTDSEHSYIRRFGEIKNSSRQMIEKLKDGVQPHLLSDTED